MIRIRIDAGHGGKDSGAVGNWILEKNRALSLSLKVGKILEKYNIEVGYIRIKDEFVRLTKRAKIANDFKADIFVSIHINSAQDSNANGIETLYYPKSIKGMELARSIQGKLKDIGMRDRGIKPRGDLTVLRKTKMPAVLVEAGFISNRNDIGIILNREDKIAEFIAEGILNYLGMGLIIEDNKPSEWGKEDWKWGILNNVTDGSRPKEKASREEVISMIRRAKGVE